MTVKAENNNLFSDNAPFTYKVANMLIKPFFTKEEVKEILVMKEHSFHLLRKKHKIFEPDISSEGSRLLYKFNKVFFLIKIREGKLDPDDAFSLFTKHSILDDAYFEKYFLNKP